MSNFGTNLVFAKPFNCPSNLYFYWTLDSNDWSDKMLTNESFYRGRKGSHGRGRSLRISEWQMEMEFARDTRSVHGFGVGSCGYVVLHSSLHSSSSHMGSIPCLSSVPSCPSHELICVEKHSVQGLGEARRSGTSL